MSSSNSYMSYSSNYTSVSSSDSYMSDSSNNTSMSSSNLDSMDSLNISESDDLSLSPNSNSFNWFLIEMRSPILNPVNI